MCDGDADHFTDPCDLLGSCEAVFLKVMSQVQEGTSLQILAVTEDDQQTLLLQKQAQVHISIHVRTGFGIKHSDLSIYHATLSSLKMS